MQTSVRERPRTCLKAEKRQRSYTTYNLMTPGAEQGEQLNGRRFVILNQAQYATFIGRKRKSNKEY